MIARVIIILLALCVAGLLAGLTLAKEEPADFTFVSGAEPETLDPALMTGVLEGRLASALFEGLTTCNPRDLSAQPGMAERWEISDDGRVYTFHLREAKWSNGAPVTAHDFVYSWRRVLDPKTGASYAYQLYYVKNAKAYNEGELSDFAQVGIRADGDRKLVVTLERRTPFFLSLTWFMTLLPVNRQCIETHGETWTRPDAIVTNGPFLLQDWRINRRLRLRRNPEYWDAANVRSPVVDALTMEAPGAGFNMYETGGADLLTSVPPQLVDVLMDRDDFHSSTYLGTYFYRFNVTRPPLDDVRVRKALTMSINREHVTRYVTKGGEVPAATFVPIDMPGYTSGRGLPFDPDRAKALLAEAGYPGGKGFPKIEIVFNTSDFHKSIAEVVQDMWRRHLGIDAQLVNKEWKVYLADTRALKYEVARSAWIGDYCDANTFLDMFVTDGGNNRTGWSDKRYDALIAAAADEPNPGRRMKLFQQAETILCTEGVPIAPIYFMTASNMYRANVRGVYPNVLNLILLKWVWVEQ